MSDSKAPEPAVPEPAATTLTQPALTKQQTEEVALSDALPAGQSRQWGLSNPFRTGFLLTLGALGALVLGFAIRDLTSVIIYIVFAIFIALGLQPIVRRLQKLGWSRTWSVVATMVGLLAVGAGVLGVVIPTFATQFMVFIGYIPTMIKDFRASDLYATLNEFFDDGLGTFVAQIQAFITDPANIAAIGGGALQTGASLINLTSGLIIVLVLSIYFVATLPQMKNSMVQLVAARSRDRVNDLAEQVMSSTGSYVGGMVILAAMNAAFTAVLFLILQLPFAVLMGVIAFCITIIPMIGTVLFWGLASVIALLTNPMAALIFALVYFVYMQIEAYVLTPRVMNKAVAVPAPLVVIGAVAGGSLLGLLGAFIAIPIAAAILIVIQQVWIPKQNQKI